MTDFSKFYKRVVQTYRLSFPFNRWVHLVCALYVPGVAFGDVDKLTPVTLFEMPYSRWGAKVWTSVFAQFSVSLCLRMRPYAWVAFYTRQNTLKMFDFIYSRLLLRSDGFNAIWPANCTPTSSLAMLAYSHRSFRTQTSQITVISER